MSAILTNVQPETNGGYPTSPQDVATNGAYPAQHRPLARSSGRQLASSHGTLIGSGGHPIGAFSSISGGSSTGPTSGPVLRKKLFDQSVADWSSRYKKNTQILETLTRDCDTLRVEASKHQLVVDNQAETFRQLEERFTNDAIPKLMESKASLEVAAQQKQHLLAEQSESRKVKAHLAKEKRIMIGDIERRQAELARLAELRERLEAQLYSFEVQLTQVVGERERIDKELDLVQHNLRQHTELADEAHQELERTCVGIKDSVINKMLPPVRLEGSASVTDVGGELLA